MFSPGIKQKYVCSLSLMYKVYSTWVNKQLMSSLSFTRTSEQENMKEELHAKVYKKFLDMMENRNTPSALRAPETPPDWLDKEACRKGREYYFSSSAATSMSSMEALLLGFCIPNFYKPLIVSRKSHVKEDATTRYTLNSSIHYPDNCDHLSYDQNVIKLIKLFNFLLHIT